jgi:hypothetical protein
MAPVALSIALLLDWGETWRRSAVRIDPMMHARRDVQPAT